jgi:hypothetical protein
MIYRYSNFADQNARRTSRRRRTHERPSGPRPSGRVQARSWLSTRPSSLKKGEASRLNTTENSGRKQVRNQLGH